MDKNMISEERVKEILEKVLNEETQKVKRDEYARIQFKMDELAASLSETIKELRKLQDSVPNGLKGVVSGKVNSISNNLYGSQKLLTQLKDKVKSYKRASLAQQVEEKKTK
jgi:hypothetical protein